MKVEITRPDELYDKVILNFDKTSARKLQAKPFNVEVVAEGLLITFPTIDHHKAKKVTRSKNECYISLFEDFEDGTYSMEKKGDDYLIPIQFEIE